MRYYWCHVTYTDVDGSPLPYGNDGGGWHVRVCLPADDEAHARRLAAELAIKATPFDTDSYDITVERGHETSLSCL